MDKKNKKRVDGKCCFCGEDDYCLLDVHRIKPGEEGGKYTKANTITSCASCHRKCHSGRIKIFAKHFTSAGRYVLLCEIDGKEQIVEC